MAEPEELLGHVYYRLEQVHAIYKKQYDKRRRPSAFKVWVSGCGYMCATVHLCSCLQPQLGSSAPVEHLLDLCFHQ